MVSHKVVPKPNPTLKNSTQTRFEPISTLYFHRSVSVSPGSPGNPAMPEYPNLPGVPGDP